MEHQNITTDELAIMIKAGFDATDKRFDATDKRFDGVDKRFDGVDKEIVGIKNQLNKIEASMVTKPYLDDKLAELEGSVIVRQRKEDQKVNLLIDLLRKKSVLQDTDVRSLNDIEVFPAAPRALG